MPSTNIPFRLVTAFALLIAVLGIVGWQGARHLRRLNAETQQIFSTHWQKSKITREAFRLSNLNNRITLLVFMLEDQDEIQRLLIQRAANTERISVLVGVLDVSLDQPEEKRLLAAVKARRTPYVNTYKRALALLITERKREEARRIMIQETLPLLVAYHDAWNDFYQYQSDEIATAMVKSEADFAIGQRQFLLMVGAALLITIATAGFTFWRMGREIAERKQAHKQLLETSRQAGRAEVATSVLHNVGNVLNSVNIASSCVAENLRKSKTVNLAKVVTMLREHEADLGTFLTSDAKGKQMPNYLAQLAEHLASEQAAALKELAELQKNIEHIMDIVNMQQSFAKVSGLLETLQVTDLVEDALKMNASSFARHEIEVVREFKNVPSVSVEKHNVLQILVNLVRNAKDACDDSGRLDKRLTLCVSNGQEHVRIAVTDNGIGIPSENLTRIFNHGFTTRKNGHGFGLHSGALAAKDMGGSLTVQSGGLGQGATFTLELPCPAREISHE